MAKLLRLLRWSDLVFQNNISLRTLIPALLVRKPSLVVHQTWLQDPRGRVTWNNQIKRALLPHVTNIAISKAIADTLRASSLLIGNPYDDAIFRVLSGIERDRQLAFVGRLVSDKGADLLLQAVNMLREEDVYADLTIVGSGPEEESLKRLSSDLGLDGQITFAGETSGAELAEILNRHRILVVPSRWAEPFGIVALEGIACGCVVVGSSNGGLKEAIGSCGLLFENGNTQALAQQLKRLLNDGGLCHQLREPAPEHLARFRADAVAAAYLEIMRKLLE
jgi:glycosyltransferase involved in cell wall biosynthesis